MLNFPDTPSIGQTFQQWSWDGSKWVPVNNPSVTSYNGRTGQVTPQTGDETSGQRVLINRQTVGAAVASVDFLGFISSNYDDYALDVFGASVSTTSSTQQLRASFDGATFSAASVYAYAWIHTNSNNSSTFGGGAATGAINIGPSMTNEATTVADTRIKFANPLSANRKQIMYESSYFNAGSGTFFAAGAGSLVGANAFSAILGLRYQFSVGNVLTGVFSLYGIKR